MNDLELMPEPEDPNLLTTVDRNAPGYPGSEYGLTDQEADKLRFSLSPIYKLLWPWGAIIFSITTVFILLTWSLISPYVTKVLPDSEWAYEDSGIRDLQRSGLSGEGVKVCIVDTGIDVEHPEFENLNLAGFRDFQLEIHDNPRDIGKESHGTLMSGLLAANGTFTGSAPGVSLSVAIALDSSGESTDGSKVSRAINWCAISQEADIISLSLGSNPAKEMVPLSDTVEAVLQALNSGVFVVAAAGNSAVGENNSDVSTPASIEGVIAVGAHSRDGNAWKNSAIGGDLDPISGENRRYPNQKPEVSAPGVLLWSSISTVNQAPYAYSTGTSDSTMIVTGALALILQQHSDIISGVDSEIDKEEMNKVKIALAISSSDTIDSNPIHDSKLGYGTLNAKAWSDEIENVFSSQ